MAEKTTAITLSSPVSVLAGIGPTRQRALERLGIETVRDLLFHIPRAYEDRSSVSLLAEVPSGEKATFLLTVGSQPSSVRLRGNLSLTKFRAFDASGTVEITYFNQNFLKNVFTVGETFRFSGKLEQKGKKLFLSSPTHELYQEDIPLPDYIPCYRLSEGVTAAVLQKAVHQALSLAKGTLVDYLPEDIRQRNGLPTLFSALFGLHFPNNIEDIRRGARRLAFDEFFLFALRLQLLKATDREQTAPPFVYADKTLFLSRLPYTLTGAQMRACDEIAKDIQTGVPMNRILIGDVGSGKTVCAMYAVFLALYSGHQAAIMAPTEILTRQHFADMQPFFEGMGYRVCLLVGSMSEKEKRDVYRRLEAQGDERIDLIVGTHALLSQKTVFADLGLVVTDEQHRFGVLQRAALRNKASGAHLLVMSATPIPRTLALTLYGDLAMSVLDEMPRGRQRVDTFVVDGTYRPRLLAFIRKQVEEGGQVYVVCPAIEEEIEEETVPLSDLMPKDRQEPRLPLVYATQEAEALQKAFPDLRVGLLHGKMKAAEKEAVMEAFAKGELPVLVSTTVIEVGINVPNANLMLIENAERFGLAQLHQLRGRVGRGSRKSYCVLLSDAKNETARRRLETMRTVYDGFKVAEEDLKLRGPGDFFAASGAEEFRQSGGLAFRFAHLCQEENLIIKATEEAKSLLEGKTALYPEKHQALKEELAYMFDKNRGTIS